MRQWMAPMCRHMYFLHSSQVSYMFALVNFPILTQTNLVVQCFPHDIYQLALHTHCPELVECTCQFLYSKLHPHMPLLNPTNYPVIQGRVFAFSSAKATYFAPSDDSGTGGMHHTRIHSVMSWRSGPPWHNCVFVKQNNFIPGMQGLHIAHMLLFFQFSHKGISYPCAFVTWFETLGEEPCPAT